MVQIYAPKKTKVGDKVNFLKFNNRSISEIQSLNDISTLKQIYDEVSDFANKLLESNKIMEEYKFDEDILEAIDENKDIIKKKREIIQVIEERFRDLKRDDLINSNSEFINNNPENIKYL